MGERGVSDAEVVERQLDSEGVQGGGTRVRLVEVGEEGAFGDLED